MRVPSNAGTRPCSTQSCMLIRNNAEGDGGPKQPAHLCKLVLRQQPGMYLLGRDACRSTHCGSRRSCIARQHGCGAAQAAQQGHGLGGFGAHHVSCAAGMVGWVGATVLASSKRGLAQVISTASMGASCVEASHSSFNRPHNLLAPSPMPAPASLSALPAHLTQPASWPSTATKQPVAPANNRGGPEAMISEASCKPGRERGPTNNGPARQQCPSSCTQPPATRPSTHPLCQAPPVPPPPLRQTLRQPRPAVPGCQRPHAGHAPAQ